LCALGSLISPRPIISREFTGRASRGAASEMQNGEKATRRVDEGRGSPGTEKVVGGEEVIGLDADIAPMQAERRRRGEG